MSNDMIFDGLCGICGCLLKIHIPEVVFNKLPTIQQERLYEGKVLQMCDECWEAIS